MALLLPYQLLTIDSASYSPACLLSIDTHQPESTWVHVMSLQQDHSPRPDSRCSCLMISGHDFRSERQANVHFIAQQLAQRGPMRFFSIGFSFLSVLKNDPRQSLWKRANTVEAYKGVDTYLWRTLVHPFNLKPAALDPVATAWFKSYARRAPALLRRWIAEADIIILESGMAVILFDLIKELNPTANVIYLCSDALDTIGCAPHLRRELARVALLLDGIRIPSKYLKSEFPDSRGLFYVPHGIDPTIADNNEPSPYPPGTHLVSVGSMLFDPTFFEMAAAAFPEITFHIIGGGAKAANLSAPNIVSYGEMPFRKTIPYIKHATAGVASYEGGKVAPYLIDTSMKLMQFGFLGVPAVCPDTVAGERIGRFGYKPGDRSSIVGAINDAIAFGHFQGCAALPWSDVTDRIIQPERYPDTHINAKAKA